MVPGRACCSRRSMRFKGDHACAPHRSACQSTPIWRKCFTSRAAGKPRLTSICWYLAGLARVPTPAKKNRCLESERSIRSVLAPMSSIARLYASWPVDAAADQKRSFLRRPGDPPSGAAAAHFVSHRTALDRGRSRFRWSSSPRQPGGQRLSGICSAAVRTSH